MPKHTIASKQLRLKVDVMRGCSKTINCVKFIFLDQYFCKAADPSTLFLSQVVRDKYHIEIQPGPNQILMRDKGQPGTDENVVGQVMDVFNGIQVYHVCSNRLSGSEEHLREVAKTASKVQILAIKKFHVPEGNFEEGDFLIYIRGTVEKLRSFLRSVTDYVDKQLLSYSLEQLYEGLRIPVDKGRPVTEIIIEKLASDFHEAAASLCLTIIEMQPLCIDTSDIKQKRPRNCIKFTFKGSIASIHELYVRVDAIVTNLMEQAVYVEQEGLVQDKLNHLDKYFPEMTGKIFKLSADSVLFLDRNYDIQGLVKRLKLKTWTLGRQDFDVEEIKILETEYKNRSLRDAMKACNIFWDEILFAEAEILITCDEKICKRFIEQCKKILKTFVRETQVCYSFDNQLYIQIFRKYFEKSIEKKYNAVFSVKGKELIRNNFTKYTEAIQQQLASARDKIKKKIVRLVSQVQLGSEFHSKLFCQKLRPQGYSESQLGCRTYRLGKMSIKMKRIDSLKRQEDYIAYIIDDRIREESHFYRIIEQDQINYNSFHSEVYRKKNPDRLRHYSTPDSQYARNTVLLHAGRQKVSNTLKRDIQKLFGLFKQRIVVGLFEHKEGFLPDVFAVLLEEILEYLSNSVEPELTHSMAADNDTDCCFQAQFYYEGDQGHLWSIERVMKQFSWNSEKIQKISSYTIEPFDLEKIYPLQYQSLEVQHSGKVVRLSPALAHLFDYQFFKTRARENSRRFIFSSPQLSPRPDDQHSALTQQAVEFVINRKLRRVFKVTHDAGKWGWSIYPHILELQSQDHQYCQLMKYTEVIQKYLVYVEYIVIGAKSASDGLHGRETELCQEFYMCVEGRSQAVPIDIVLENQIIVKSSDRPKLKIEVKCRQISHWVQITTYNQQLQRITQYIEENSPAH